MKLKDLNTEQLKTIADRAGTSLAYLQHIKYGYRKPGPNLARKIEAATGGRISRLELLYPDEAL